mgnify:FL=1
MNRILLSLCALMLSASAANAQNLLSSSVQVSKRNVVTANTGNIQLRDLTAPVQVKANKSLAPQKLNANQKSVGLDGSGSMVTAVGVPDIVAQGGIVKGAYNLMDASLLARFAGGKIVGMRYLIGAELGSSAKVQLYNCDKEGKPELFAEKEAAQKVSTYDSKNKKYNEEWNEVYFDKALNVSDVVTGLFVGYTYKQKTTKSGGQFTEACYPLAAGQGSGAVAVYGDLGKGTAFYGLNTGGLVLCIQVIVEKEGGFADDLGMVGVATNPMLRPTDKLPLQFYVKNYGSSECKAASFDITIDKNVVANVAIPEGATIGGETTGFNATLNLSELDIENGTHLLGVQVKTVNGEAASGYTDDDVAATQFRTYTETASRQYNLLEHFTSSTCTYCPLGYDMLRALQKQRDDVAWVAIHGTMDENKPDPYEIADATKTIMAYSISGFPQANLNRFPINNGGSLAVTIATDDPEGMATSIGNVFDQIDEIVPSQVRLDIETNFNRLNAISDGTLKITIKGTGVKGAGKILEDAVLGLYITENGLVSGQLNQGKWITKYNHENVLRVIGTENPWGDAITWDGDNFEKTYEVSISADYFENSNNTFNAVAFVSLPYMFEIDGKRYVNGDKYNVWVNQCQFLQIPEGTGTAIKGVETSENATVVARYAADGSQISAPVKGINILKMSDGTTRKVVVK